MEITTLVTLFGIDAITHTLMYADGVIARSVQHAADMLPSPLATAQLPTLYNLTALSHIIADMCGNHTLSIDWICLLDDARTHHALIKHNLPIPYAQTSALLFEQHITNDLRYYCLSQGPFIMQLTALARLHNLQLLTIINNTSALLYLASEKQLLPITNALEEMNKRDENQSSCFILFQQNIKKLIPDIYNNQYEPGEGQFDSQERKLSLNEKQLLYIGYYVSKQEKSY